MQTEGDQSARRLDGFVGPGHVSTVIGLRPYRFIAADYRKPVVVSGFEPLDVMQSVLMLIRQVNAGRHEVENEYTRVVTEEGNLKAQALVSEVFEDDGKSFVGWAVEGRPADCVKLALLELLREPPDVIVSGMNAGSNAGINVLYSGTVAAAIEGAFFGITSVAVSLEYDEHAQFDRAAVMAREIIEQILEHEESRQQLFNLNFPTAAMRPTLPSFTPRT